MELKRTPSLMTAMAGAAAVTAQFVSGKATRDALFLTSLDFTALPMMLVATSVCSIALVAANGRGVRRIAPRILVPASFMASGILFLLESLLRSRAPSVVAALVYVHISGAGPLLASGFWLIASEGFDPRTAKKRFGQIAGVGTLGGLLSALLAERVAALYGVPAMLPLLAGLNFLSGWLVWRLAAKVETAAPSSTTPLFQPETQPVSGLRTLSRTPYLRNLAALVLLSATGAALVDYLFKARAVETFGHGDHLLRFFALYYAAISLVTLIVQTSLCRIILERFGLGPTTGTSAGALLAGSIGALVAPGFGSLLVARGGESVFRGSLFRAGYELFYTPIPAADKRAAKSLIDVTFDRLGDAAGGGLVRLAVLLAPAAQSPAILGLAVVCSAGAIFAASRLPRGYLGSLEHSLVDLSRRAGGIDQSGARGTATRDRTLGRLRSDAADLASVPVRNPSIGQAVRPAPLPADVQDMVVLRSADKSRIIEVLGREDGLTAALVPQAITLLAWDPVADHALFALRKVAEERIGQLTDALIDPNQDFSVRRRLARVFSICVSQRAADGLLLGLDDVRFDVRYQSARSLAAIVDKNPGIAIDREHVFEVVLREVAVGRPVWESRRVLDAFDADDSRSALDEFVRDRASDSLAHVFTLLSLALPAEPLRIAFRSLHTNDPYLQGTALEYLEGVLPTRIRQRLWPFLEVRPLTRPTRPREDVIADLLRSNHSIMLNLENLRRQNLLVAGSA